MNNQDRPNPILHDNEVNVHWSNYTSDNNQENKPQLLQ
jgi:hypothetical protein